MVNLPIPAYIRPQLIPFLFKETEGTEASYMDKTVKSIMIYPFSSIGRFLYSQMCSYWKVGKQDRFLFYLTVEKKSFNVYNGYVYVEIDKVKEPLMLPEAEVNYINNLIEDMFRIGFVYYVDGSVENCDDSQVRRAIDKFIEKYDLLEVGFSNNTLRTLYYRERTKGERLSRMQYQASNRVMNFDQTM